MNITDLSGRSVGGLIPSSEANNKTRGFKPLFLLHIFLKGFLYF